MGNGDQPHTFGDTLRDTRQLGFAGTQSNDLLRRGPTPNLVLTAHAHSSARRPAGVEATGK
eukprot:11315882-Alexandrium_andersonii.AAC.1